MEKYLKLKIDSLLNDHEFITYNMLDVYQFENQMNKKQINCVSNELYIIKSYLDSIGIEFKRYGDCCGGKKFLENEMGYHCNEKKRRKLKLQRLNHSPGTQR